MLDIKVAGHLCPKNYPCPVVRACPKGAVVQNSPFEAPFIDRSKCTSCGVCTYFCAFGAFQGNMN